MQTAVPQTLDLHKEPEATRNLYGMDRPELVARWLLTDLSRRDEIKKKKSGRG